MPSKEFGFPSFEGFFSHYQAHPEMSFGMESRCESGSQKTTDLWLCGQAVLFFDEWLSVIALEHTAQHFFALFEVPPHADKHGVSTL